MKKENKKLTPKELGDILFDFILHYTASFLKKDFSKSNKLSNTKIKDEDLDHHETLILYMWFVFHFLNTYGGKFEKTTHYINGKFMEATNVPEGLEEDVLSLLYSRYLEYKDIFERKKSNFQGVAMVALKHILKKTDQMTPFLGFELGAHMICLVKPLLEILNGIEIID